MSLGHIIGIPVAFAIILIAILIGGSLSSFLNGPSMLIVVGGTLTAVAIRYSVADIIKSLKTVGQLTKGSRCISDYEAIIDTTDNIIRMAKKNGIKSLEGFQTDNEFYNQGLGMFVDGFNKELIKSTLEDKRNIFMQRHHNSSKVFDSIGDAAPAFGMIGTLVGLIQMLSNMSDPASIGPAMAVAMLTTLYGAVIANVVALPLAEKVKSWVHGEAELQELIIKSIEAISSGQSSLVARETLSIYLHKQILKDI